MKLPIALFLSFAPAALLAADANSSPTPAAPVKQTKANYELATRWTPAKVDKMLFDTAVTPHWLDNGDRFWYAWENTKGRRFYMVDPVKKTKSQVFDPVHVAALLTEQTGIPYDSQHLPFRTIKFVKNDGTIQFDLSVSKDAKIPGEKVATPDEDDPQQRRGGGAAAAGGPAGAANKTLTFEYELSTGKLVLLPERPARKPRWASVSPDDQTIVFARNHNLYMMDAANYAKALKNPKDTTIAETQLTTDGVEDFDYARTAMQLEQQQQQQNEQEGTQNNEEGDSQDKNARVPAIMIAWARDSKKFSLIRRDERKVGQLWVINALAQPRPKLETYRYQMPGEVDGPIPQIEVFDVAAKSHILVKADAFKDQLVSIETDRATNHAREHEKNEQLWVGEGSSKMYFTRTSRDMHRMDICIADTTTGEAKPVIQERMNVYIESKPLRPINNGTELLHWSERDGWGHYYLYSADGTLKNQVTRGEFVSEEIMGVDEKARAMFIMAEGREDGEDPYYTHIYRANLDGSGMKLLDPGNESHTVLMSDSGHFFVDNASRVNTAPKAVLYDNQGGRALDLEAVDVTPMTNAGFRFPEPFEVKADDGITDLYGVMYKPFDFDPNKKYPIVAYVYPGPQTESVTKTFSPKNQNVVLAQLGFIVIEVGNRGGNPHRSEWYHTFGYGNLRDYGLADKKAAIEQLAERFPFIDIERVGITGHSGGGFMSTAAMLIYPDFFKVAVSESGNHENNIYNRNWSEKHHGVKEVTDKDGKVHFEYDIDKNSEIAKNLKGHLLLSTGDVDNNVHPANTIRLMDALIKANKRFDFFMLPGKRHSYADEAQYFSWIRNDYFCKYLLGDFDQSIDMWELSKEKPAAEKKSAASTTRGPE
jgi:dipeptidyl aminopeptidase/acylaminoacyl peptidase